MNRSKILTRIASVALLVAALAFAASAQVMQVSGKVSLKKADGTVVPLPGATVKFYRTDIKQEFETKTDKGGRFTHAGIPLVGVYTVVVSGPGAHPTYSIGYKPTLSPENNTVLEEGDGSTLTLADVATLEAMRGKTGSSGASAADTAAAKKKADEIAAARKKIEEENSKASEINAKLPDIMKAGNEAYAAKNYDAALAKYEEGLALDAKQPNILRNKTLALLGRGTDRYNAGVKAKDQAGKDAGRADFKAATETAEQAISVKREMKAAAAAPGAAAGQTNDDLPFLSTRFDAYKVALQTSTQVDNDAAAKAIEEYINAETDQVKKDKAQSSLGDALFFAGRVDDSIAKFREVLAKNPNNLDAMFGLGISLAAKVTDATKDASILTEAHDVLQQFVAKAPEGYPRKQEAAESVKYLEDTIKTTADARNSKSTKTRKP
jgi:tetratricopeptide (TPR) repeat protein